jgi:hypothetical protein
MISLPMQTSKEKLESHSHMHVQLISNPTGSSSYYDPSFFSTRPLYHFSNRFTQLSMPFVLPFLIPLNSKSINIIT